MAQAETCSPTNPYPTDCSFSYPYDNSDTPQQACVDSYSCNTLYPNAHFTNDQITETVEYYNKLSDKSYRDSVFNICDGCTVFTLSTFDNSDHRINGEFFEVTTPHCVDSFNIPGASWNDTTNGAFYNPPSQLINDYYECYNKRTQSFILAFGSAAGSAGLLAALFIIVLVFSVTQVYKRKFQRAEKKNRAKNRYSAKVVPDGNYIGTNSNNSETDDDGKLLKGSGAKYV